MPDGGSSKKNNKADKPVEVTVASNPNYIAPQQVQPFAPGMQEALASQLSQAYGRGGLLGTNDYTGLLNSIYSPQAIAADPIGVAQQVAAATAQQQKKAQPGLIQSSQAPENEGLRGGRNMGGQR